MNNSGTILSHQSSFESIQLCKKSFYLSASAVVSDSASILSLWLLRYRPLHWTIWQSSPWMLYTRQSQSSIRRFQKPDNLPLSGSGFCRIFTAYNIPKQIIDALYCLLVFFLPANVLFPCLWAALNFHHLAICSSSASVLVITCPASSWAMDFSINAIFLSLRCARLKPNQSPCRRPQSYNCRTDCHR